MKIDSNSKRRAERGLHRPPRGDRSFAETKVTRPFHAWLHYHVLAHVDVGTTTTSLHDCTRPWRAWVRPLTTAILHDPERAQHLPLRTLDYPAMHAAAGDDALGRALRDAWTCEHDSVASAWQSDGGYAERLERFWDTTAGPLSRCRVALWDDPPPRLTVLDVPMMGRQARGCTLDRGRVVALDLRASPAELFCRLLHHEVGARDARGVTMRLASTGGGPFDGRGSDAPLHVNADASGTNRIDRLVEAWAPEMVDAMHVWRRQNEWHAQTACD